VPTKIASQARDGRPTDRRLVKYDADMEVAKFDRQMKTMMKLSVYSKEERSRPRCTPRHEQG
jgi:hypothetical protein